VTIQIAKTLIGRVRVADQAVRVDARQAPLDGLLDLRLVTTLPDGAALHEQCGAGQASHRRGEIAALRLPVTVGELLLDEPLQSLFGGLAIPRLQFFRPCGRKDD